MPDAPEAANLRVAVIGAGPAGFYTAEALASRCPAVEVAIIERLPTPYGLIRSGVAPDHQTTKRIQETFETIATAPNIDFIGNVEVGRDITLAEIREIYDAVVLSSGVPDDSKLDIPGSRLPGVYGASEFVGWYNGHPDYTDLAPSLERPGVVVIGNGNVAIDVARILSKSPSELCQSDIAEYALKQIVDRPAGDVHIVGRRGPLDAKFTAVELAELSELEQAVTLADPAQLPENLGDDLPPRERRLKGKILESFRAFSKADAGKCSRRIHFRFNARPVEIVGKGRVEAIRLEETIVENGRAVGTGRISEIACSAVISAIGYRARSFEGLEVCSSGISLLNENGQIAPALYVAGWLRRGPSGKIGTNRADGELVAERIRTEIKPDTKPGTKALRRSLAAKGVRITTFADWKRIEACERAGHRILKVTEIAHMLNLCAPVPDYF
jgi:NADPH-dependent glutamate synthase beta subunit-like oxidoreductase